MKSMLTIVFADYWNDFIQRMRQRKQEREKLITGAAKGKTQGHNLLSNS